MLLKAGTYRFNDVLTDFPNNIYNVPISVTFNVTFEGGTIEFKGFYVNAGIFFDYIKEDDRRLTCYGFEKFLWESDILQSHTITADTEVDEHFGNWYIVNTNYNEVNATEDKKYIEVASWYTSVANAIRSKKGTTAPILRDDFAREIESISVGEEVAEYDGTVVIEKAESVLGLRRFKEPMITNEGLTPITNVEEYNSYMSDVNNYCPCEFIATSSAGVVSPTYPYLLAIYINTEETNQYEIVLTMQTGELSNEDTTIYRVVNGKVTYSVFGNITYTMNITGSSNLDEWLLANTEGVSE